MSTTQSPSRPPYWFHAKRYGWGWGLPATWQGWVVLIMWIAIVTAGSRAKFAQNATLRQALLDTVGTELVEASPFDRIWGIGLAATDARATDPSQWRGQNLLGKILTRVRDELLAA